MERLRDQAREAVEHSSYRQVARQAGISPETLRQFIEGSTPYERTLDRLKGLLARDAPQVPYGSTAPPLPLYGSAPFAGRSYPTGRRARPSPPRAVRSSEDAERVAVRLHSARRAFESDAELADFLGVDRAQPARWRAGQVPDPENRERLVALDVVIELLSGYLSLSSIPKWLHGVNAHLGNRRPIAVLREGSLSEVVAAIEAEKSGAFA
ncbi:MAG TPA: hypothetical protein VF746_19720 [Longimicrobium sp.]